MNDSRIGNSALISQVNSRLVLQAIRLMQPTFRAAVARKTGLKPATVTVIVNELLKQDMLKETPQPVANVRYGRPPLMLEINGDARRVLAIDLEPDRLRVALTDLLLRVGEYRERLIDRFQPPEAIFPLLFELCDPLLKDVKRRQRLGIGVSLPGLIDREQGVLISSTNMSRWKDVPVKRLLEDRYGMPVHVERALHLAAVYEQWVNPQPSDRTTLILSLRTGVGASMMHGGELYVGNAGFDGEIGHTVIDLNGRPCECGSRGCLETFVGAPSIVQRGRESVAAGKAPALRAAVEEAQEALTPELIYRLAREGDSGCAEIVRDVAKYLGIAVSNLINLLAPHEVVICGSIDTADSLILGAIREQVNGSALPRTRERTTIRLSSERDRLPLLGAAVLVAGQIFALPRLAHRPGGIAEPVEEPPTVAEGAGAGSARPAGKRRSRPARQRRRGISAGSEAT